MQKNLFELNLLSQGIIEQDYLSKNVKKIGSDKNINFSNESVKKTTTYDLIFINATYFLKNVNTQYSVETPSNKTPALRRSTNMGVWTVGTLNHLFIGGS